MKIKPINILIATVLILLGLCAFDRYGLTDKKKNVASTTPINNITISILNETGDVKLDNRLKISYQFKGQKEEYITPNGGCDRGAELKNFDFNQDGTDELIASCVAGAHSYDIFPLQITGSGDLGPLCVTDYEKDFKEREVCSFYVDNKRLERYAVLDLNNDGYLDLMMGNLDSEIDPTDATIYLHYLWDKEKGKLVRS